MKLQLPSGKEVKVAVIYGEQDVTQRKQQVKRRTTTVRITLMKPGTATDAERCQGQPSFEGVVACSAREPFTRKQGKRIALLRLFGKDTEAAIDRAIQAATTSSKQKEHDKRSLIGDAKNFYTFSRPDRTVLFKAICCEYSRNDPERQAVREKMTFERLARKFGLWEEDMAESIGLKGRKLPFAHELPKPKVLKVKKGRSIGPHRELEARFGTP